MMKRSFFLAAGLLASLSFGSSIQAANVLLESDNAVTATKGTGSADVEITFSSTPTGPITILGTTTVTVTSTGISGDTVTINYTPIVGNQEVDFTFSGAASSIVSASSVTGGFGGSTGAVLGVASSVFPSAVPEPTSMALLGIGMTGFLAFRRFFSKRTANA